MQRRSLSVLSIGWFFPGDVPPLFHPGVVTGRDREQTGRFGLCPLDGTWFITIHELQQVTPLSILRTTVPPDPVLMASPLANPYAAGDLAELVGFLECEAAIHDLIVIGLCMGEGRRRVQALPLSVRQKTVVTYWETLTTTGEESLRGQVLDVVSRQLLVGWLVERVQTTGRETTHLAMGPSESFEGRVRATEITLAAEGAGLGV